MRTRLPLVASAFSTLLLVACGGGSAQPSGNPAPQDTGGPSASATPGMPRRVEVQMVDSAFKPAAIDIKQGEVVSFVLTNHGQVAHDAHIGTEAEQQTIEQAMRAMKDGSHEGHEGGVLVAPGETGSLRRTFAEPGRFEIGCHQVGHYPAMKVTINVT
jgi:uncharacterized cupredoxin-like copper-binding protein